MESFVASKLAEYYVGLTFKSATMGKAGATSTPYAQMHYEAQWNFQAAIQDDNVEIQWDLGDVSESNTLVRRRLGLQETFIVEEINRILLGDDAIDEMMQDTAMIEEFAQDGLEWLDLKNCDATLDAAP